MSAQTNAINAPFGSTDRPKILAIINAVCAGRNTTVDRIYVEPLRSLFSKLESGSQDEVLPRVLAQLVDDPQKVYSNLIAWRATTLKEDSLPLNHPYVVFRKTIQLPSLSASLRTEDWKPKGKVAAAALAPQEQKAKPKATTVAPQEEKTKPKATKPKAKKPTASRRAEKVLGIGRKRKNPAKRGNDVVDLADDDDDDEKKVAEEEAPEEEVPEGAAKKKRTNNGSKSTKTKPRNEDSDDEEDPDYKEGDSDTESDNEDDKKSKKKKKKPAPAPAREKESKEAKEDDDAPAPPPRPLVKAKRYAKPADPKPKAVTFSRPVEAKAIPPSKPAEVKEDPADVPKIKIIDPATVKRVRDYIAAFTQSLLPALQGYLEIKVFGMLTPDGSSTFTPDAKAVLKACLDHPLRFSMEHFLYHYLCVGKGAAAVNSTAMALITSEATMSKYQKGMESEAPFNFFSFFWDRSLAGQNTALKDMEATLAAISGYRPAPMSTSSAYSAVALSAMSESSGKQLAAATLVSLTAPPADGKSVVEDPKPVVEDPKPVAKPDDKSKADSKLEVKGESKVEVKTEPKVQPGAKTEEKAPAPAPVQPQVPPPPPAAPAAASQDLPVPVPQEQKKADLAPPPQDLPVPAANEQKAPLAEPLSPEFDAKANEDIINGVNDPVNTGEAKDEKVTSDDVKQASAGLPAIFPSQLGAAAPKPGEADVSMSTSDIHGSFVGV